MIALRRLLPSVFLWITGTAFAQAPTPAPAPDLVSRPVEAPQPPPLPLDPSLPTLFIAGDSTAAFGKGENQQGWAAPFAAYFDPSKINVANRARGGRSSRTFITEGLWDKLLADLKPGDVVLIQFGHNDASPVNEDESVPPAARRARGTLPGVGEETLGITNIISKKPEVVRTYGSYLRQMIADTRSKGATPVILSTTVRNIWTSGRIERGPGFYRTWAYEVAKATAVPFIDHATAMADSFDALGAEKTAALYPQDHTHFNAAGADLHAAAVVAGLKGWKPNLVARVLSAKGEAVPADTSAWLRLPTATNPALPTLFLAGDSTVRNHDGSGYKGQWGWGDFLGAHLNLSKINLVNRAVGGTSSRTFRSPTRFWGRLLAQLRPGDVVLIQFGHNDSGPKGTLPGIGDETEPRPAVGDIPADTTHTFGWYLRKNIADVRAAGATPILCSLVPRKKWDGDKIVRSKDSYAGWTEQIAKEQGVAFIDLNELIAQRYDALGAQKVETLFADEHTHTSATGAALNAEVVATALRTLPDFPLASALK